MGQRAYALLLRAVLGCSFAAVLWAGLPGHLSVDSVMALHEGRFQVRETFGPIVYAALIGAFDRVRPGTSLYVLASAATLFGALFLLTTLRSRVAWPAVAVAVLMALSPTLLLFQGIVWKDVLFANLSVAGFVCIAYAMKSWEVPGQRWAAVLGAGLLLAVAMSIRQNGIVMAFGAAACLLFAGASAAPGWTRVVRALAWGLMVVLLAAVLGRLSQPATLRADKALSTGMRILQHYDVVGVVARDRTEDLGVIAAHRPEAATVIRKAAPRIYSPERVDFFDRSPEASRALWKTPLADMKAQWLEVISQHPAQYLAHRSVAFRWVFLTPRPERCVAVFTGVTGPTDKLTALEMAPRMAQKDLALSRYASLFLGSPAYSHLFFAVLALASIGLLLLRRDPTDIAMAGLLSSALGFVASFFFISIACDYRYLYVLDLAALTGALYLALDPPALRPATRPKSPGLLD